MPLALSRHGSGSDDSSGLMPPHSVLSSSDQTSEPSEPHMQHMLESTPDVSKRPPYHACHLGGGAAVKKLVNYGFPQEEEVAKLVKQEGAFAANQPDYEGLLDSVKDPPWLSFSVHSTSCCHRTLLRQPRLIRMFGTVCSSKSKM